MEKKVIESKKPMSCIEAITQIKKNFQRFLILLVMGNKSGAETIDIDAILDFIEAAKDMQEAHYGFGWLVYDPYIKLDIENAIAVSERLINDKQLDVCAAIEKPVQEIKVGDFTYELSIVIKLKE
jgi:hypothetical protein